MKKAVVVISHGSRLAKTIDELSLLLDRIKSQNEQITIFKYAFLEIAQPDIPTAIISAIDEGAGQVIVVLNFLNAGMHVDEDIPQIIREVQEKYPAVKITLTPPVGQHEKIADLFTDMIQKAL